MSAHDKKHRSSKRSTSYDVLEQQIGYAFSDRDLLVQALTHSSATKGTKRVKHDNYERLEFLGDRVLGLAISELMLTTYPTENEGQIARRLNRLVRKETCADVARYLDLGPYLFLSTGEVRQGGRDKDTILGDVAEALLGAVYLDGGYEAAREIVMRLWAGYLNKDLGSSRDPKSALQEWAQAKGYASPKYDLIKREGPDHEPQFECKVMIGDIKPTKGKGKSIREAQQEAAIAMLKRQKIDVPDRTVPTRRTSSRT